MHRGSPPCRRCDKSGIAGCLLTRPRQPRPPAREREPHGPSPPVARIPACDEAAAAPGPPDRAAIDAHVSRLPPGVVLKALSVFLNSFPELAILHLPTFMSELQATRSPESKALLGAVLAVTRAQLSVLTASWADELLPRDQYAYYARETLSGLILQPPRLQVVQALLIVTLHEWGSRDFHKAWVYCGIAIRIMQALHSLRVAPYPLDLAPEKHDAVSVALETRTYWACFVMDCMVNSGTYNPPMLPMSEMQKLKIARPLSAVEFAFGPDDAPREHLLAGQATGILDVTQSFEILVGGFDIWTQVMTFIFNDGRRAPGMSAPPNCPWAPGSPWSQSRSQLDAWRAGQHRKLHYPSNSVAIHMTLSLGETFVYLNLLYYVSTLMLHREYFPFLPTLGSEPQGPVDHPRLEAPAPPGWWEESARQLFGAAESIARILHEASECGVHLMTPFAGFCAFSAGYICLYVFRFPRMNLGRSPDAEACLGMCLAYLHQFRHVWPIADGWVSGPPRSAQAMLGSASGRASLTHGQIKTIQQASLLYERAVKDGQRYRGRTRDDFDTLHQSIHEFRVVDRSGAHDREIDGAERVVASAPYTPDHQDTNTLLNQLLAEVSSNLDEQGAWSQWWPPVEQQQVDFGL